MKRLATTIVSLSLLPITPAAIAQAQGLSGDAAASLRINPGGSQPSAKGSAEYFTGAVRVDPLFPATAPSRVSGGHVTFELGARSAWHTHPVGQALIVTSGLGWVQQWGGPKQEVRTGDIVWFPPGLKHWHGASATTAMTHIAIQEAVDGKNVDWLEQVSDEQYNGR
jgi:quercetin dioxygenase-like cupin family protein